MGDRVQMKRRRSVNWAVMLVAAVEVAFASESLIERVVLADDDDGAAQSKIDGDFAKALTLAKENYAGQVDIERVVKSSVLGMLHTLDPHSSYLDKKEWQSFQNEQRSRYSGIGSMLEQRSGTGQIMSPFAGTPA